MHGLIVCKYDECGPIESSNAQNIAPVGGSVSSMDATFGDIHRTDTLSDSESLVLWSARSKQVTIAWTTVSSVEANAYEGEISICSDPMAFRILRGDNDFSMYFLMPASPVVFIFDTRVSKIGSRRVCCCWI